jgi:DNA polymerase-3 subunit delta
MSVDTGSSASAKKTQRIVLIELINNTLAKFKKKIQPRVAELLIERVGFHPVAAVMESEKLAMYTGDNPTIEQEDLDALVGRTRQEALFELTEALGNKNIEMAMLLSDRLQDNGIHALAIIATLRNFAKNLLLFRSLQSLPLYGYSSSMSPTAFQNQCLPELKNTGKWSKELSIHPYALYMKFKTASTFSLTSLQNWLELLLAAELKLKGSPIDSVIVIQHLILTMLTNTANGTLKKSNRELKYSII